MNVFPAAGSDTGTQPAADADRAQPAADADRAYMELDKRERQEKNSVAIASNESFSSWTKTFTDPRLCAAIVGRLTFGGNIIETASSTK